MGILLVVSDCGKRQESEDGHTSEESIGVARIFQRGGHTVSK